MGRKAMGEKRRPIERWESRGGWGSRTLCGGRRRSDVGEEEDEKESSGKSERSEGDEMRGRSRRTRRGEVR
jgi:hypothetical protein